MRTASSAHPARAAGRRLPGLAVALALVATGLSPVLPAAAQEEPQAEPAAAATGAAPDPAPQRVGTDWGPNADGWNVTIINDTDDMLAIRPVWHVAITNHTLAHRPVLRTDNVSYAPAKIGPHSRATGIRGTASWSGGPANMSVGYYGLGTSDIIRISISANDDGDVEANCHHDGHTCDVTQAVSNEPIVVRYH
jgi:hypothetical protein